MCDAVPPLRDSAAVAALAAACVPACADAVDAEEKGDEEMDEDEDEDEDGDGDEFCTCPTAATKACTVATRSKWGAPNRSA
jgi:hypothetical protein